MKSRVVVGLLRVLLAGALVVIFLLQLVVLPWLSEVMAEDLPGEAYMRWPILILAILGLGCVQVGIVCTLRLLGYMRRGQVFSARALRWVDGIIGSFLAASLRPPEVVVRMACDRGFFFALDYRKGVEIW